MSAATKRRSSPRGRARSNRPKDYWQRKDSRWTLGRDRFRVRGLPGAGGGDVRDLDAATDSFSWSDQSAILTGQLNLRLNTTPVRVDEGSRIRVEWSHAGGPWRELWTMRVLKPTVSAAGRTVAVQLADDLTYLQMSKDDFHYVKDKHHPKGWLPHEVVADICRRYGVRVGHLPRTTTRIKRMSLRGRSPLDAIVWAMKKEKVARGIKMTIAWRDGALTITPLTRSRELLVLGPTIVEAQYSAAVLDEGFATVAKVTATGPKTKAGKRRKIELTVRSDVAVRKYGFVHTTMRVDAESEDEARRIAKRRLARAARPTRELTITHPGIPTLRRGHALRASVPTIGVQQIVYVTEVNHQVDASGYSMDVTVRFTDPFEDKKKTKDAKARCAAARKRGKTSEACGGARTRTSAPAAKTSRQRTRRNKQRAARSSP